MKNPTQKEKSKQLSEITVTLPQALLILNHLNDEVAMLKLKAGPDAEKCMVDIQVPPDLINEELVFARVQILGDLMAYSFHFYPDDVVSEATIAH